MVSDDVNGIVMVIILIIFMFKFGSPKNVKNKLFNQN